MRHAAGLLPTAWAVILICCSDPAVAESQVLELASPFVDDAILQRGMEVPVWGWAEPGREITVAFAGQSVAATAGEMGEWDGEARPARCVANRTQTGRHQRS